jgi:iron(III) transport system permease protein
VQAYLEITGSFNLPLGATLAVLLLLPSATAFLVQRYWLERRRFVTVTGKPGRSTVKIVAPAVKWGLFVFCWLLAALVLAFYGAIGVGAFTQVWGYNFTPTLTHLTYALSTGFETVKDTLVVALVVTPVSGLLAMLIAFLVVRGRFAGRSLLELTAILPFALPGTVVGIGYILAFNDRPIQITGTLAILVLSFVFRYMPVGIQSGTALLRGIDPSIEEAARNLGASSLTTFQKVTLPLIAPAFFTGLTFAFIRAMTAISAAIFLVSAKWNLLTVQILSEVGSGRLGVAAAYSLILVAVVMVATGIISLVVRRVAGRSIAAAVGGMS